MTLSLEKLYQKTDVAQALYYSTATLAGAFSGLIAYAIGKHLTLHETGKEPWRWLFIIEGVIGISSGAIILLLLPSFPDKMKKGKNWLFTEEEIQLAIKRFCSNCMPRGIAAPIQSLADICVLSSFQHPQLQG